MRSMLRRTAASARRCGMRAAGGFCVASSFASGSTSDGYGFELAHARRPGTDPAIYPTACAANIGKTHDETGIWMVQRNSCSGPPAPELAHSSPQVMPDSAGLAPGGPGAVPLALRLSP